MPKKILIVSHVFPPAPGIGGRRWVKFAKYLNRKGYDITVLTSETVSDQLSEWNEDAKGLKIETVPFRFPKAVANSRQDLLSKLSYFIWVYILKFIESGNYFDKTIFWRKQTQNKISELITKQGVECVIVTGGPFKLTNHVLRLKKKFPTIKFIADFRDLWTEDSEITFFSVMSLKRKRYEKKLEKETVLLADKVITTMDSMTNYFSSLSVADKFVTISNGYDPDDFGNITIEEQPKKDKIVFVYAGTLYINLQYIIKPFFEAIGNLKKKRPELYEKLEFKFIGKFPAEYKAFIDEYNIHEAIKVFNSLPLRETLQKIRIADYCLLILNDVYSFNLSTKFFEYISQKKKVVVVSNGGSASEFIVSNKLGVWFHPFTCYENLVKLTTDPSASKWESDYNVEQFSLNSLTNKLIDVIEEKPVLANSIQKRNLLLTFDYELFLGKRSGTVKNCIIKPTNLLLDIFSKYKLANAIFFVDCTYLKRLSESPEPECISDLELIKKQLTDIIARGHYIFPHLHPHWKDAVYDKKVKQWRLEKSDFYRFHSISDQERDSIFSYSISLIKEIMVLAGRTYAIDSFRAGGWCLQPFSDFKPYFEKYGIRNDFSALRGFSLSGKNIFYDFTFIPIKNIYKFSEELDQMDSAGKFTEFVISVLSVSNKRRFLNKFLYKYLSLIKDRSFGDGFSAVDGEASVIRSLQDMHEETLYKSEMASVELMTLLTYPAYKEYIDANDYMHLISHPKMVNKHNLACFEILLKRITGSYEVNTDYRKLIN
jgi:hypothetical protein